MELPRRDRFVSVAILGYLAVQVLVPLWLVSRGPLDAPSDFSWDMFSHRLACQKIAGVGRLPSGQRFELSLAEHFKSWASLRRVLYPARLEGFARFLCADLVEQYGANVELRLRIECTTDFAGETVRLADPKRNYCGTPF